VRGTSVPPPDALRWTSRESTLFAALREH